METTENQTYTVDELSKLSGVAKRNIRFYVSKKLVPRPLGETRASRYDITHLEALERIKAYQAKGYSLSLIQSLFEKARQRDKQTEARASEECFYEIPVAKGVSLKFNADDCGLDQEKRIALSQKIKSMIQELQQDLTSNGKAANS